MTASKWISALVWIAVVGFAIQDSVPTASAQSNLCINCDGPADVDVLLFGGVMTEGDFPGWSNIPFAAPLQDNYSVGAAINREFIDLGLGFHLGGEIGLAGRFGDGTSAEVWGGPSLRHDGFSVGPAIISFGLVMGLSAVTGPIGIERNVEVNNDGDATLLWYLGPEVAISFDALPNTEFVSRTHHRSGAANLSFLPTLGDMPDTSNANIFGIRRRF